MKFVLLLVVPVFLLAQSKPGAEQEQLDLSKAISEAGNSGIDYLRALERHLAKYPDTARRAEIEKALAKSAMEANDRDRIVKYGEKVLQSEPNSEDLELLDRVTRILLDSDSPEAAGRALIYAKRYEVAVE